MFVIYPGSIYKNKVLCLASFKSFHFFKHDFYAAEHDTKPRKVSRRIFLAQFQKGRMKLHNHHHSLVLSKEPAICQSGQEVSDSPDTGFDGVLSFVTQYTLNFSEGQKLRTSGTSFEASPSAWHGLRFLLSQGLWKEGGSHEEWRIVWQCSPTGI